MINEYSSGLTQLNLLNNMPKEWNDLRNHYRDNGVPTMLLDSLNLLLTFVKLKKPKRILELGTSVGCSGIAMLLTSPDTTLVTIEKSPVIQEEAIENFKKFGLQDRVTFVLGDSVDESIFIPGPFDIIFLDCNKASYLTLYPILKDELAPDGVLITDNVLFRGYVSNEIETPKHHRTLTQKIDEYNRFVINDKDMITTILDVGDGILIATRK